MTVNSEHTRAFRSDLHQWYRAMARDLPWRASTDPYQIWISEIMLQQTRVDQALPYFNRFVSVFPDVRSLASASLDHVLRCWEGLGYYRRARHLHQAAQQIVAVYDGHFPSTLDAALSLPGVGAYTAAAITSIAFGVPAAAVDGNVLRVMSRVFGIEEDIKSTTTRRIIRNLAQEVLDPERPGDSNQSVMELGATVCTPRNPTCGACPLQTVCLARRHNMTDLIPTTVPRKPTPHHTISVGVVFDDRNRLLLVQRPQDGLLGGLWEYPGARRNDGESLSEACVRGIREKLELNVIPHHEVTSFDHQYSHFGITVHAFVCSIAQHSRIGEDLARHMWLPVCELDDVAMHKSSRRISTLVANQQLEQLASVDVH